MSAARDKIPYIYSFLNQVYESLPNLFFNKDLVLSQVGAQGDLLGSLVFSLSIHEIISDLNLWYLDDCTIGGKPEIMTRDLQILIQCLNTLGLEVNQTKCEFPLW